MSVTYDPERQAAVKAVAMARQIYGVDADPGWAAQIAAANERRAIAAHLYQISSDRSTLALHAGEMTAGEFRTIKAVLQWQARMLDPSLPSPLSSEGK